MEREITRFPEEIEKKSEPAHSYEEKEPELTIAEVKTMEEVHQEVLAENDQKVKNVAEVFEELFEEEDEEEDEEEFTAAPPELIDRLKIEEVIEKLIEDENITSEMKNYYEEFEYIFPYENPIILWLMAFTAHTREESEQDDSKAIRVASKILTVLLEINLGMLLDKEKFQIYRLYMSGELTREEAGEVYTKIEEDRLKKSNTHIALAN